MNIFQKNPDPEAKKPTGKTGSKKYPPDTIGAVSYLISSFSSLHLTPLETPSYIFVNENDAAFEVFPVLLSYC